MTIPAPVITGFETRDQLGLRPPKSVSRNITPGKGGVAVHYRGAGAQPDSHDRCRADWRGFQAYHMDVHGWVDIAYTVGFCSHGVVFAGRGFGTRTAANGTNDANDRFYAACWLGGEASRPTVEGLRALTWVINECRVNGGAGLAVRPHRSFKSTSCPGDPLARFTVDLDGNPISSVEVVPGPPAALVPRKERLMHIVKDQQGVNHWLVGPGFVTLIPNMDELASAVLLYGEPQAMNTADITRLQWLMSRAAAALHPTSPAPAPEPEPAPTEPVAS